jgi:hypothetical protein
MVGYFRVVDDNLWIGGLENQGKRKTVTKGMDHDGTKMMDCICR